MFEKQINLQNDQCDIRLAANDHLVDVINHSVIATISPTDCHNCYVNMYIIMLTLSHFMLRFLLKYRYISALEFLFRNSSFASNFIFFFSFLHDLSFSLQENKFIEKLDLQKDEFAER